jgi:hypothetical protein
VNDVRLLQPMSARDDGCSRRRSTRVLLLDFRRQARTSPLEDDTGDAGTILQTIVGSVDDGINFLVHHAVIDDSDRCFVLHRSSFGSL